jgi:GcrA cell cycle regulator
VSGALSSDQLHARLAPLAYRGWPVGRLAAIYHDRVAGLTVMEIARRHNVSDDTVGSVTRRMFAAGLLEPRQAEWPRERIATFKALWIEGLSIAEISRRIGITKSAGVGESHRLIANGTIAARPRFAGNVGPHEQARRKRVAMTPEERRIKDVERQRIARAAKRAANPKPPRPARLAPLALNRPLRRELRPKAAERIPYVPPPPKYGRIAQCCWPIGEPGTQAFHFCDKPTDPGRPYCHAHVGKAYTKVPVAMSAQA